MSAESNKWIIYLCTLISLLNNHFVSFTEYLNGLDILKIQAPWHSFVCLAIRILITNINQPKLESNERKLNNGIWEIQYTVINSKRFRIKKHHK